MSSVDYILRHFLTIEQVAEQSGVAIEKIQALMDAQCLPGPAYVLDGQAKVSSIFGDHDETLTQPYYPHSHIAKARELAEDEESDLKALSDRLNTEFKAAYREQLVKMRAQQYGLAHLFADSGEVAGPQADELLEQEWQHYLKGTYGLCTRTAMVEDIAAKEIMIAKIKHLSDQIDTCEGDAEQLKLELKRSVNLLDSVSMPFAPHEYARSSRATYIDAVRSKYALPKG